MLADLDDADENIFLSGIADKYMFRPTSLESLTLAEFASWYRTDSKTKHSDDIEANILQKDDNDDGVQKWEVTTSSGKVVIKRREKKID